MQKWVSLTGLKEENLGYWVREDSEQPLSPTVKQQLWRHTKKNKPDFVFFLTDPQKIYKRINEQSSLMCFPRLVSTLWYLHFKGKIHN